ncbi:MAG TPA: class I SAM-dependent methyltransferase [Acidimicrobiales bacterium]|nr:class I SAM-dependent methyltransferase [Acidimicrobiales bacterium]
MTVLTCRANQEAAGGVPAGRGLAHVGPAAPLELEALTAADYKQMQRNYWGLAARGWREWWHLFESALQPVSDAMVELAAVTAGHHVVDLATGIGEPAATAARRVGRGGSVVGTDLSPQMLAIGKERAEIEGLANLEFRTMDAEWPDFPPASFDAVLCRLGLMFLPDLSGTLERISALLMPGGRLCAAVWGPPASCPFLTLTRSTVAQYLELPAPPPDAPGPFRLSAAGALEEALAGAGFTGIVTQRIATSFAWSSAEEFARFQQSVAAPVHGMLEGQSAELRAEVWKAVTLAARHRAGRDGAVRLEAELVLVAGEVGGG